MFFLFRHIYLSHSIFLSDYQNNLIIYDRKKSKEIDRFKSKENFEQKNSSSLLEELTSNPNSITIYMGEKDFIKTQIEFWKSCLNKPSVKNLYWLHKNYIKDLRLKTVGSFYNIRHIEKIRTLRPIPIDHFEKIYSECEPKTLLPVKDSLGFEYLLASYLSKNNQQWSNIFFTKIAYFSWRQIIQEFAVVRNQLLNALHNNINPSLPKKYKLDYKLDIEAQLYSNPYLSWMTDINFREDNITYIKNNYDINIIAELYDNWIKYRRPMTRNEGDEFKLDNLTWITRAIQNEDWKLLFEQNLNRDFGCIYVDNWLIPKANQVWTGAIYREVNHNPSSYEIRSKLKLKSL